MNLRRWQFTGLELEHFTGSPNVQGRAGTGSGHSPAGCPAGPVRFPDNEAAASAMRPNAASTSIAFPVVEGRQLRLNEWDIFLLHRPFAGLKFEHFASGANVQGSARKGFTGSCIKHCAIGALSRG
jgi:hypothetical protein